MSQFIHVQSPTGGITRINVEGILLYGPHLHQKSLCLLDADGNCAANSDIGLSDTSWLCQAKEPPDDIDRMIAPSHTPG